MDKNTNWAEQLQKIFDSNFDLNHFITRIPANTLTDNNNSVTTFDLNNIDADCILNAPFAGSVKSFINYDIELNKSAVQRTLLGYVGASLMVKNKTVALQTLVLYLNNALIELTRVLGSAIVTNTANKIEVSFIDMEDFASIEMRVKLLLNKE